MLRSLLRNPTSVARSYEQNLTPREPKANEVATRRVAASFSSLAASTLREGGEQEPEGFLLAVVLRTTQLRRSCTYNLRRRSDEGASEPPMSEAKRPYNKRTS